MRSLAVTVLVLGLLGATAAAFAVTEALKLDRSPIGATRFDRHFSPGCGCGQDTSTLIFQLRSEDRVDAAIVDRDGEEIRTLVADAEHAKGAVTLGWDGRDDAGVVVPDGRYRLRIHLDEDRRTVDVPKTIHVDTTPPRIELENPDTQALSPDGDGRRDLLEIPYALSEPARLLVLVDGQPAARTKLRRRHEASVEWDGTLDGRPAPAGLYTVSLQAQDRAGNASVPSDAIGVEIRYIELDSHSFVRTAGAELRFRVTTDAETFAWALRRPGRRRPLLSGDSERPPVTARLPRRLKPGRYILRVSANGHSDRALVRIVRGRQ